MRYILALILCFQFNLNYDIEGFYCSEGKWFTLEFKKPNKVFVTGTERTGHFPTVGFGTYEYRDSIIYINYLHHRKDTAIAIYNDYNKDSLTIIVKDDYDKEPIWGAKVTFKNHIISRETDINGKVVLPRLEDEILINVPISLSPHIFSFKHRGNNVSGYEVHYDQTIYIEQKKDTLRVESISDSVIVLKGNIILTKDNCRKKTIRF